MSDFNILDHLRNMRFGMGGGEQQTGDGLANVEETPKVIEEGAKKVPGTAAKLIEGIPIIGPLFAFLIPINSGEVSMFSGLETQGIAGKNITKGGGTQGGVIYNIVSALFKNSTVTDQTGGAGGGGEAFASSGGGGGFSDTAMPALSFGDFVGAPSNSYDWSPVAMASLGALPRPTLPDAGSVGEGVSIA